MRLAPFLVVLALAATAGWFLAPRRASIFGEPLYVGGQRVPEQEIALWLVYGPGHERLEARKTRWMCALEIERLAAREVRGAPERELEARRASAAEGLRQRTRASDEELELEYGFAAEEFLLRNPARDLEAELGRAHRSSAWFRDELRVQLEFDKLFFPEEPAEWPEETWQALAESVPGASGLSRREQRAQLGAGGWRSLRRSDPLRLDELRRRVHATLSAQCRFRTATEGLAAGLALSADSDGDGCAELEVSIDELWHEVRDTVEPWEVDEIRRWIVTCRATSQRLEREGAQVTVQERERALALLRERSEGSLDVLRRTGADERFPWPQMYAEYFVLSEIHRAHTGALLDAGSANASNGPAADLLRRARRSSWMHAEGRVNVEVLLVPALDIPHNLWIEGGWPSSERKARELLATIERNEQQWNARRGDRLPLAAGLVEPFVLWNRLLDQESGWWDPPDPRGGELARQPRNHGRFYGRTWEELRRFLGESSYTDWVHGPGLAERVFFTLEPGRVTGPWRCALGWCLVRVCARQEPERWLDANERPDLQRMDEDQQRESFAAYAREAVRAAQVEGLAD